MQPAFAARTSPTEASATINPTSASRSTRSRGCSRWRSRSLGRRNMSFEPLGKEIVFAGKIATVSIERYRHDDGEEVTREKVSHPGAVGIIAVDGEQVWLTRQPREVI